MQKNEIFYFFPFPRKKVTYTNKNFEETMRNLTPNLKNENNTSIKPQGKKKS